MSVSFSTIVQRARPSVQQATSQALRDVLNKIPATSVTALSNGFRVACEENKFSQFATVGVWMDVGTKYESRENNGVAKLLSACGFEATANQSKAQMSKAIEDIGGHLHVETGKEQSYVYVKCHKDNVDKAVGLIADVVRNARLSDEDIAAGQVLLQEKNHRADEHVDDMVMENLHMCAFDSTDNGLGLPKYGSVTSIPAITKEVASAFRSQHYKANRMVLVGSGGVNHAKLEGLANQHFGDLGALPKPAVETRYVGGDYRLWNLRYKTAHVAWAFETCGANSGDVIPLTLATHVYGNFHRSQHELGQHAVHRVLKTFSSLDHGTPTNTHFPEQAIEVANTFIKTYEDAGLCGMYIVGRPWKTSPAGPADSMQELVQYSMMDWCRLTQRNVHPTELEQAKINYKSQLLFNRDGATLSAEDIGRQVLLHGRRVPLDEMYARIDDCTDVNMQETLQHYFYGRRPVFSMAGYIYIMPNYDWMVNWTWKFWY